MTECIPAAFLSPLLCKEGVGEVDRAAIASSAWSRLLIAFSAALLIVSVASPIFAADRGDDLKICDSVEPTEINPLTNASTISGNMSQLIFDSLIEYTDSGEMIPSLANRWEISEDGKTWTFFLRDDVFFHNGKKLTARDVAATYNAIRSPSNGFFSFGLSNLKELKVIDDSTIQFFFNRYDSFLPHFYFLIRILPEELLASGLEGAKTIGTGPYELVEFSKDRIELRSFERHFRGRPNLDKIEVDILQSQRACISSLIAGRLDLVFVDDSADIQSILGVPGIDNIDTGMGLIYLLILNQKDPELRDRNVRRALNYGLDRNYVAKYIRQSEGDIIDMSLNSFWGKEGSSVHYTFEPRLAQELFEKAGYTDNDKDHILNNRGKDMVISVSTVKGSALTTRILNLVKSAFENIGVIIKIEECDMADMFKKLYDKQYDAAMIPIAIHDSIRMQYLLWHSNQRQTNFASYSNPDVDRLLDEVRYNRDEPIRKQAQVELVKAMMDDPPGIPLFIKKTKILVQDRFRGFSTDSNNFFSGLRNVWVPKDLQIKERQ